MRKLLPVKRKLHEAGISIFEITFYSEHRKHASHTQRAAFQTNSHCSDHSGGGNQGGFLLAHLSVGFYLHIRTLSRSIIEPCPISVRTLKSTLSKRKSLSLVRGTVLGRYLVLLIRFELVYLSCKRQTTLLFLLGKQKTFRDSSIFPAVDGH